MDKVALTLLSSSCYQGAMFENRRRPRGTVLLAFRCHQVVLSLYLFLFYLTARCPALCVAWGRGTGCLETVRHVNPPDLSVDSLGILVWKQEAWGPLSDSNDELCSRANQSVA